jgi:hypothetical protein
VIGPNTSQAGDRAAFRRNFAAGLGKFGMPKTCKGLPRGMPTTHADVINADLLDFITR